MVSNSAEIKIALFTWIGSDTLIASPPPAKQLSQYFLDDTPLAILYRKYQISYELESPVFIFPFYFHYPLL